MIRIRVEGMSCPNCARHVKEALAGLEGVSEVKVSLEQGEAEVEAVGEVGDELIRQALEEEGYGVKAILRS